MDFKVIFRETFIEDLERIVRSIALHNPDAARKLGAIIIEMSERLAFFPERHPRVRERPNVRRFIVKKYFKVFYRIRDESKTVEILRCWDGRQASLPRLDE